MTDNEGGIEYAKPTPTEREFLAWASKEAAKRANETQAQRVARLECNARWLEKIAGQLRADGEAGHGG
jgi:hypothetical protein